MIYCNYLLESSAQVSWTHMRLPGPLPFSHSQGVKRAGFVYVFVYVFLHLAHQMLVDS